MAMTCGWRILWSSRRQIRRKRLLRRKRVLPRQSRRNNKRGGRAAETLELGFLRRARFPCPRDLVLLSFLVVLSRLFVFLPALLSAFGCSLLFFSVLGRSHIFFFSLGRGCALRFLKLMRVIGILVHPSRRNKFHIGLLWLLLWSPRLIRLLLRWDAPRLRCVLISPGRRSNFHSGLQLLLLGSAQLIHLLRRRDAPGLRGALISPGRRSNFHSGLQLLLLG